MPPSAAPWLLLAGSATALALALAATLGILRLGGRPADIGLGAITWAATVAIKIALAIAILRPLVSAFHGHLPLPIEIACTGLLTGLTECAMALPLILLTARRWRSFQSGIAFGAGFGAAEAIILAAPLFLVAAVGLLIPTALSGQDMSSVRDLLTDPWRGPEFAAERLFAGLVHILAGVLIVESVRRRKWSLFVWAFLLKSAMDAIPTDRGLSRWAVESAYAALAIISLEVLVRMWRTVRHSSPQPPLQT